MSKKVLVFDISPGVLGLEARWLVEDLFPQVGITEFTIHGFEACRANFVASVKNIGMLPGVYLHPMAIGAHEGICRLYHSVSSDGHSIFDTKNNLVDPATQFEDVPCMRLSTWIKANVPSFPADINILRFNVEGAEWPLIEDLDQSGLLGHFQIVCGACGTDINVVKELSDAGRLQQFLAILTKWNVQQFWFCYDNINDVKSKQVMLERLQALVGA